jgi:hypothetical protein
MSETSKKHTKKHASELKIEMNNDWLYYNNARLSVFARNSSLPRQARDQHKEQPKYKMRLSSHRKVSQPPAENGFFEPFIYKNDHFAKTGSGQT